VSVTERGKPIVTVDSKASRQSVVGFTKTGERVVGHLAKRQAVLNPEKTIYSAKRFIGGVIRKCNRKFRMFRSASWSDPTMPCAS
jgi:molecular chaperone DnaK